MHVLAVALFGDGAPAETLGDEPWYFTLLLFAVSGAFGGVLALIQYADVLKIVRGESDPISKENFPNVVVGVFLSALGGIGGAFAALFIMVADDKITGGPLTAKAKLTYVTTGVIAGFLGLRFLKYVAEKWDKEVADTAKQAAKETAKEEVRDVRGEIDDQIAKGRDQVRRLRAIQLGARSQLPQFDKDAPDAIHALEEIAPKFPGDREVAILLAWLYANREPVREGDAIRVLSKAIDQLEAKADLAQVEKSNLSDMLYNRACYRAREAARKGVATAPGLAAGRTALADLDRSCTLNRANWQYAIEKDEKKEFEPLRELPEFQAMARKYA